MSSLFPSGCLDLLGGVIEGDVRLGGRRVCVNLREYIEFGEWEHATHDIDVHPCNTYELHSTCCVCVWRQGQPTAIQAMFRRALNPV